ncbi:MAG: CvpA family protein [Candidatus Omnitrophica bacterium]|nr:CvpA family protein [Candidatus Omnitrophota bacterium]
MLDSYFTHLKISAIVTKIGWVDIAAFCAVCWGTITGLRKGLESELGKFTEVAAAVILSYHYYPALSVLLNTKLSAPKGAADFFSFLGLAILSILALKIFFNLAGTVVSLKFMGAISRVGGAVAGAARCVLAFSLMSALLLMVPIGFFRNSYSAERSWSGPFFAQTSVKFYRLFVNHLPLKLPEPGFLKPA